MKIKVCNHYLLRVPILPFSKLTSIPINPTQEEMFAFIRNAMSIPVLRAAIFSASPAFLRVLLTALLCNRLFHPIP